MGAINFITRKPGDEFNAGLSATLGRFQTTEFEGYVSGPINDSMRARLALKDSRSRQGWQESHTRPGDHLGEKDKQTYRGMLEWDASDSLFFRLTIDGWQDHSEAQARQVIGIRQQNGADPTGELFLPPQARAYPLITNEDPQKGDWPDTRDWRLNDSFLSGSLRWDWDLSERVTLTGLASHMKVESEDTELPSSGFNYTAFEEVLNAFIESTALELRFSGVLGETDSLQWQVGGNYGEDRGYEHHRQLAEFQSALFPDPATGRSSVADSLDIYGKTRVEQAAAFANLTWNLNEAWTLAVGARYTEQSQDYEGCSAVSSQSEYDLLSGTFTGLSALTAAQYSASTGQPGSSSTVTQGECFTLAEDGSTQPYTDTLDEDNVAFRVALDWKPTDNSMYYATIGRGYKAGGYPVLGASTQDQLEPVVQEELLAFELGSKFNSDDRQLQLNLAAYFYDYTNKQLLSKSRDPIFGPLAVLQNAPSSQVYGAEADLKYSATFLPGLFIALSAAYTETEIKEFIGLDSSGNEYDFAGRPFNFAPREQATLLLSYARPFTDTLDWSITADYRYSGTTSSSLDDDPVFEHGAYDVWGLRAAIEAEQWHVAAFGRNLDNELVPVTILAYGDSISRFNAAPRYYGLTIEYNWY